MYLELVKHQGAVTEWSDGTFSFHNQNSDLVWSKKTVEGLTDPRITCFIIDPAKIHAKSTDKFTRWRSPVRIYYVKGECNRELLANCWVVKEKHENIPTNVRETKAPTSGYYLLDAENIGV